jgi:poly(3-hydroxybutyrate) depolymerase
MGQMVTIWAGTKGATKAPILFYWHGTGSMASEAQFIMGTQIQEIMGEGGVVASFTTSTKMGTDTGDAVWYTGDFAMADQILACAVQQLNIDTRRIYTAGCSAGGLQAGAMVYSRSSYLAASMPNSGGVVFAFPMDDPSHVPALITTHGGSSDMVVVSFAQTSATEDNDIAMKGGYVVDCNHGGGHCGAPANDIAAQWQFCKDHPFGVSPNPYASGLPSSFPTYCTIIK